jgi:hypothetical protein
MLGRVLAVLKAAEKYPADRRAIGSIRRLRLECKSARGTGQSAGRAVRAPNDRNALDRQKTPLDLRSACFRIGNLNVENLFEVLSYFFRKVQEIMRNQYTARGVCADLYECSITLI